MPRLVLLALTGCAPALSPGLAPPASPATGTAADTAADTADTADPDGDAAAPPACGPYSALDQVGAVAAWESQPAWEEAHEDPLAWEEEMGGEAPFGLQVGWTVVQTGTLALDGVDDYTWSDTAFYRCDADGVWLLGTEAAWSYTVDGTPFGGATVEAYHPPLRLHPLDPWVEPAWSHTTERHTTDAFGETTIDAVTRAVSVIDGGPITVAAGSFAGVALRVAETGQPERTVWLGRGVGPLTDGDALWLADFSAPTAADAR